MSGTVSGMSAMAQYVSVVKDEDKYATSWAKTDGATESNVTTFEKDATSISSAADLLNNYKALKVVLGAYGMSDYIDQTAVIKDLLTQDPSSTTSLAETSGNATWLKFAKAMSSWSSDSTMSSDTISSIVSDYLTNSYEDSQDTGGLGDALYFTRNVTSGTTLNDIMSDSKLLNVVEVALGYDPTQFGALDYDQQKKILTDKLDLSDFSTPEKVQRFAEQYLTLSQVNPTTSTESYSMLSLYGASGSSVGILSLFTGSDDSSDSGSSLYSALY